MRAPLPVLEMLYHEQPQFHAIVRAGYLSRVAQIATADWLYSRIVEGVSEETLAARGLRMPEQLTSLATWLTMAADNCEDDFDVNRWVSYVQYLMASSLPFMSPYHGANLIDAVDRSECGPQQRLLIVGWFDLYRAVARRDAAEMASKGRELLQIMPANAPAAHRSYLLDAAVLGEIASGRIPEALAICQQYVPDIYGEGLLPGHMQLLCGFAVGTWLP
jgi:hypothetical protein